MASRFRRRLVMALLAIYTVFVLVVTLTPRMPGTDFVGRFVSRVLYEFHQRGLFTSVDYLDIEFAGNILMFVPLGVFTALLLSRRAWWTLLLLGTVFSGFIETFQALFLPDRFPEVRDLLSNTTGFLLGAAASVLLRLLVAHRDRLVELDRQALVARETSSRQPGRV
jgi:glycopeptide antibiotics resistance protein